MYSVDETFAELAIRSKCNCVLAILYSGFEADYNNIYCFLVFSFAVASFLSRTSSSITDLSIFPQLLSRNAYRLRSFWLNLSPVKACIHEPFDHCYTAMSIVELQPYGLPNLVQHISTQPDIRNSSTSKSQRSTIHSDPHPSDSSTPRELSRIRASFIIVSVAGITFLNCLGQSLLIVAIPRIADDLTIPSSLVQWPTAVSALTLGCTLLVVGAIADVVGNRPVFLLGYVLHLLFMVGCALVQTGTQLIAFRALQGLALSLCMPTSVGIITSNFGTGRGRNVAFACFGGGNPVGYALGLLLGGVFVDTVGWRYGYYMSIGLNGMVLVAAFFSLPADSSGRASLQRLKTGVDWIGLSLISADLAILSYVLAYVLVRHYPIACFRPRYIPG